jgi:hypothetical protein
VILIAGMAVIIWRLLQHQPVTLSINYSFGAARAGLKTATMRYLLDNEELGRVLFNFRKGSQELDRQHQIQLPKGDYTVAIELAYSAPDVPLLLRNRPQTFLAVKGEQVVHLRRPLIVQEEGAVRIFILE